MVRRSISLTGILTLALLAGCGESKPSNPPAPAYHPPADESADGAATDGAATDDQPAPTKEPSVGEPPEAAPAEPAGREEAAPNESGAATSEEMPEENAVAAIGDTADEPKATDEEPKSTNDSEEAGTKKPGKSSGKLLRGLGSSLSRAISKAAGGEDEEDEPRPAPDLADDPFPNGEPVDSTKPKEQPE